jgi:type I restriction enzyme S subunit
LNLEGELPQSWATARLDEVCGINERSFSPLPTAYDMPIHFVPMAAVRGEFGGIDLATKRPLGEVIKGYTAFVEGNVLFAKITPCMENGKLALVPKLANHVGFGSTEFHVLHSGDAVLAAWIARYVSQLAFRRAARQDMSGSAGQLRVQTPWLAAVSVPVAPLAEQHRILQRVDEALSEIDAGVLELEAAKRKLTLYRQSLLKAAVEGALTAGWRQRRRLSSSVTSQNSGTDAPAWLPPDWRWLRVDQLPGISMSNGRSVPTAVEGAKVLRLTAVRAGRIDLGEYKLGSWSNAEAQPFAVHEGDLLVVRGNGSLSLVGRAGVVPATTEQIAYPDTLIRVRCDTGVVRPRWLACVWDSELVRNHLERRARTSAGIYKISQPDIASATLPLPSRDEQDEALALLDAELSRVDSIEQSLALAERSATAQRQNILRAAFSGQLVPQDPNDEPASVLLERVRAQRGAAGDKPAARRPRKAKIAA